MHVIGFSGGKDSTAMALRLAETEPRDYLLLCTPTGDEFPDWFEHMRAVTGMVGQLVSASTESLAGLVERERMIPSFHARFCTRRLKIEPFRRHLIRLTADGGTVTAHVGLRADEPFRQGGYYGDIPGVELRYPMREWRWGIGDVQAYLAARGVTIPRRTDCQRCFFQRLGEWWLLWKDHPDAYEDACRQERELGHTWRSPGRDSWPTSLDDLAAEFARGKVPKRTERNYGLFEAGMACGVCRL